MSGLFELSEFLTSDEYSITVSARDRGALAGRRTSLKVLKDNKLTAELVSRMRDEARVLARLRHPGMAHLFNLHSYRGRPVLEMEYLRGVSAAELMNQRHGPLPAEAALVIARTVSSALDAAYNRPVGPGEKPMRIVHRNVCLPNILLTVGGAVKLMDFIMAKGDYTDRLAISFVAPATTRGYPAPELAENNTRATAAGDVYSVGHVLYHLLTGSRLKLIGLGERHDDVADDALDHLVIKDLPADLAQRVVSLVRSMVRLDPSRRPQHREVVDSLGEILAHAQLSFDISRFAEEVITPMYEQREVVPPQLHPYWNEVNFLEDLQPDLPEMNDAVTPAIADKRMRKIVATPGWGARLGELQDLIVASGYRPFEPFLPTLDRALIPGWKVWEKKPAPLDICAALAIVAQTGAPEVLERARRLRKHTSEEVRHAATFVVSQYEDV